MGGNTDKEGSRSVLAIVITKRSQGGRVPAVMHHAGFAAGELSEGGFDLAYPLPVFPHLSEKAAGEGLRALHEALNPGGLLVLTVRPPGDSAHPVTSLPYLRDRWGDRFELVDVTMLLEDVDRVAVTLRKT